MSNMAYFKNTSGAEGTWVGQVIADGAYYLIQPIERTRWANNSEVLESLAAGEALIAADISGDNDFLDTAAQINYLKDVDASPENTDGRKIIHGTPRQYGTVTYFAGAGDDGSSQHAVGGAGQVMAWHHEIGQPAVGTVIADFATIENLTYLHAGAVQWLFARNDLITCEIIPKLVTAFDVGSGYDHTLYGGYLVVPTAPGAGDINIDPANRVLVEVPLNESGHRAGSGYYDAEWDSVGKQFVNFAPNYTGQGQFNMFTYPVTLDRFANKLAMLGDGVSPLGSHDASMFGHNCRVKLTYETVGADHDWWGNVWIVLHRKKTK